MRGSIDILLLSIIKTSDTYGYEIIKSLEERSSSAVTMGEGTLYPALKRLELKSFIESYWVDLDSGGRRKYYRITDKGRKELVDRLKDWNAISSLIKSYMEGFSWIPLKST